MSRAFTIHLEKEAYVFTAAHFITYDGSICEPIHGHNYGVWVEVDGMLDENHYVVDFVALGQQITELTGQLDHHILLPTQHPEIHVEAVGQEVVVKFDSRRWSFPRQECALLPVANTTAERLAEYLGQQLVDWLGLRGADRLTELRVAVDENRGQWGICRLPLGGTT